jgi:hypothetical protein
MVYMSHRRLINIVCVATVCALLDGISRADIVVYKITCGDYAFEAWNLTCKIDRNTLNQLWADPFRDLQSITICAYFNNRGGLNVPATIIHNRTGGEQSMPTELFDTVKFHGGLLAGATGEIGWVGTSPRFAPKTWTMRGELVATNRRQDLFTYTETLSKGQLAAGEIRATCSKLEDK